MTKDFKCAGCYTVTHLLRFRELQLSVIKNKKIILPSDQNNKKIAHYFKGGKAKAMPLGTCFITVERKPNLLKFWLFVDMVS